jgi:hypothetical protein
MLPLPGIGYEDTKTITRIITILTHGQNSAIKQILSPKPSGTTVKRTTSDSPIKNLAVMAGPFDSIIRNVHDLRKRNYMQNFLATKLVTIGWAKDRSWLRKFTRSTGKTLKQQ